VIEVSFFEHIIARKYFSVSFQNEEDDGTDTLLQPDSGTTSPAKQEAKKPMTEEEVMKVFDEMIGLETVKESVRDMYDYLKFVKHRNEKGFDDKLPQIHAVFTGNPGTGKTKTAQILGKIYQGLGLLTKGHVHEVDRTDLVGEYIGHTAPKTKEAIKKARGGILFIDEAYSLARKGDTEKDYGKEVIEILLKELSD